MKTRISSVALIKTVSHFLLFRKNTIDRVESRDVSEKDNCAASKKRINFRKTI
jgi:hypothetical protein